MRKPLTAHGLQHKIPGVKRPRIDWAHFLAETDEPARQATRISVAVRVRWGDVEDTCKAGETTTQQVVERCA